jgi:formate dehydrogenase
MTKIVWGLRDDPIDESAKTDPRNDLPGIDHRPGGQTVPTPGSESPAGGKSIFDPHLELGMP